MHSTLELAHTGVEPLLFLILPCNVTSSSMPSLQQIEPNEQCIGQQEHSGGREHHHQFEMQRGVAQAMTEDVFVVGVKLEVKVGAGIGVRGRGWRGKVVLRRQ